MPTVPATDDLESLRDDSTEATVLGDLLLRPSGAQEYVELGYKVDHFQHGVHRQIFGAALSLIDEGVTPDPPAVARRLREHQIDVSPALLSRLPDGVPKQSRQNKVAMFRRLDDLTRSRVWLQSNDHYRRQLLADPGAMGNGFLGHQLAELEALQGSAVRYRLLDDLQLLELPDPTWLVDGVVPANSTGVVWGEPGIGKTFVAIDLGVAITVGQAWLGHAVPAAAIGSVVYAASEGTAGLKTRLGAAKSARGIVADLAVGFYCWPDAVNLMSPAAVAEFIGAIRAVGPRLVVLDTLARCMVGGDENSARDMGIAVGQSDRIRKATGATVLLVHHGNKAGSGERGSTALRGGADFMLELSRTNERLTLSCSKQKDAAPFPNLHLHLVPPASGVSSCVIALADALTQRPQTGDRLTPQERQAFETLRDVFGFEGATMTEWQKAGQVPERTLYYVKAGLIQKGVVRKVKNRYFPVVPS